MIHLNLISHPHHTGNISPATESGSQSASNFQNQLSAAITATLEQFGVDPSQVNITIGPAASTTATTNTTPGLTGFAAIAAAITPAKTVTASNPSTPVINNSTPDVQTDPIEAFDEAYWAKQPVAVQALRNIDDPTQRAFQAAELAATGYKIDVPIMVWGWDPSKVTDLRKSFGYTWVPSAMQAPVEQAPGIVGFGQPYDPNNAPSGSIAV